jgi:hypothetical protein
MSIDSNLLRVLERHAAPLQVVANVTKSLEPKIRSWAGEYLVALNYSGSYAKGTAVKGGTDIDIFVSLSSHLTLSLKDIYESLFEYFLSYQPRRQNVSIGLTYLDVKVDLVPARCQNSYGGDHSLWLRKQGTWTKTNIQTHIQEVKTSNRIHEIKLIKIWRNIHNLNFPSFYLELAVIEALKGSRSSLSNNIVKVLEFLRDELISCSFIDPSNSNNIISNDLSTAEKCAIAAQAGTALQGNWTELVY